MPVREFQHEHRRSLLAMCWTSVYSSASVEEICVGWCAEVAQHKQLRGVHFACAVNGQLSRFAALFFFCVVVRDGL